MAHASRPDWTVLLLGGSSGVGKTVVARQVGHRLGVPWVQVDDLRLALQRVTTPAQQPALHFFLHTEAAWRLPPATLCEHLIAVGEVVSQAIEIVIAHHVATALPLVLEGDGILPALAAQRTVASLDVGDQVRAVFLVEPDEVVLLDTMHGRGRGYDDKPTEEQRTQARMNWLYGQWLQREALRHGLPLLAARPWSTLAERIIAASG
jgi:2-phosphoglycerate kinase